MTVNADDLPPEVRKRLGLTAGKGRTRKAPSRAGVGLSEPCPGHCGCGHPFPTAAKWEAHAKATGCTHWRIDIERLEEAR